MMMSLLYYIGHTSSIHTTHHHPTATTTNSFTHTTSSSRLLLSLSLHGHRLLWKPSLRSTSSSRLRFLLSMIVGCCGNGLRSTSSSLNASDMGDTTAVERLIASALGAGIAESVTLPVDVAKVRLQTQVPRADGSLLYRNMVQGMFVIGKNEGRTALWKGLAPALLRQMSYTSLSFVIYSPIRDLIAGENVEKDDIPFFKRVLSGVWLEVVDHVHEPDRGRQDTNADEHGAAKNQTDH